MSDMMKDLTSGAIEAENVGAPEALEAGEMVEMDDQDLEQVAGGTKEDYIEFIKRRQSEVRKKPPQRTKDKRRKRDSWD